MAYRKYNSARKKYKKRSSKYTELEKLAYQRGQLKAGLQNTNSRVYESYMNGLKNNKNNRKKKPLI